MIPTATEALEGELMSTFEPCNTRLQHLYKRYISCGGRSAQRDAFVPRYNLSARTLPHEATRSSTRTCSRPLQRLMLLRSVLVCAGRCARRRQSWCWTSTCPGVGCWVHCFCLPPPILVTRARLGVGPHRGERGFFATAARCGRAFRPALSERRFHQSVRIAVPAAAGDCRHHPAADATPGAWPR